MKVSKSAIQPGPAGANRSPEERAELKATATRVFEAIKGHVFECDEDEVRQLIHEAMGLSPPAPGFVAIPLDGWLDSRTPVVPQDFAAVSVVDGSHLGKLALIQLQALREVMPFDPDPPPWHVRLVRWFRGL